MGKRKTLKKSEAVLRLEFALERGQAHEEFRKKYEHLSVDDLYREARDMALEAARLQALYWERSEYHPTGN